MVSMYKPLLVALITAGLSCLRATAARSCSCLDTDCLLVSCTGSSLKHIPEHLNANITNLYIEQTAIKAIRRRNFVRYRHLKKIYITSLPDLHLVEAAAFNNIISLEKIEISDCPKLTKIKGKFIHRRTGSYDIQIVNCNLETIPTFLIRGDLTEREISIKLSSNQIQSISTNQFSNLAISVLSLTDNLIESIADNAFTNTSISTLKLNYNPRLRHISQKAFRGMIGLKTLDISHTAVENLPDSGLETLSNIYAKDVPNLKKLPPIYSFRSLRHAYLTYPYHCCLFKHARLEPALWKGKFRNNLEDLRKAQCGSTPQPVTSVTPSMIPGLESEQEVAYEMHRRDVNDEYEYDTSRFGNYDPIARTNGSEETNPPDDVVFGPPGSIVPTLIFVSCKESELEVNRKIEDYYHTVICTPEPDALNPCEDVMGNIPLRVVVWAVWLLAIFGNSGVFVALMMTPKVRALRVHNFLMANVAVADFFIGLYLGMLAIQDIRTAGMYYNHAVDWQTGPGCQMAGFICVFASELCIFGMMMMSFEMFYNTKFGIYSKRLSMKAAGCSIAFGWLLSLGLAVLPLYGISSYSVTSTCLPLKTDNVTERITERAYELRNAVEPSSYAWDNIYLYFVLIFNLLLFATICAFYIAIYLMVRDHDSPTAQAQDISLAKRMALLISTDFMCWAPTIFFGLTSVAGQAFISISTAKIFLVIFYPINCCTNPFIYVFLTKRFRNALSKRLSRYQCWRTYMERRRSRNYSTSTMSKSLSTVMSKLSSTLAPRQNSLIEIANPRRSSGSTSPRSSKGSNRSGSLPRPSEPAIHMSTPDRSLIVDSAANRKEKDQVLGFRPKARNISECSSSKSHDSDVIQPLLTNQDKINSTPFVRKKATIQVPLIEDNEVLELASYEKDANLADNGNIDGRFDKTSCAI